MCSACCCSNKNYFTVSLLKQIMILCLDVQQAFSCLPLIYINSINVVHTYSYDTVKQPKKQ